MEETEEVLDELLDGNPDNQLLHQFLYFDFDEDDDDDEDYTESPRQSGGERRTSSALEIGENGENRPQDENGNEDDDDNDEDEEGEEEEEDDDPTEASSIADDDDDDDELLNGEDNKKRYHLNRTLKQEAADLIEDWQKSLLEENPKPFTPVSPFLPPDLLQVRQPFKQISVQHFNSCYYSHTY
jgi:hypothetical protein